MKSAHSTLPGRRRSTISPWWIVFAVLLAVGGLGAYWLARPSVSGETPPVTAAGSSAAGAQQPVRSAKGTAPSTSHRAAKVQLLAITDAVHIYWMEDKRLPESLEALTHPNVHVSGPKPEPYLKAVPSDPWGNPYDYRLIDKKTFTIRSRGADGQPDTPDDIAWPEASR